MELGRILHEAKIMLYVLDNEKNNYARGACGCV